MGDAIVGAVIMVAITTGLVLAVQMGEQAIATAGRYPLNESERELLRSAGLGDASSMSQLNAYLQALPQKLNQ
jgi:hypothetical protein